ncbi:DUF2799 domain-containing protein [Enterovibrio calviensis]|uniref:DUF2799 domain-containing protein n=1 Tax=Enterovibrio calviensis TaxID=91359 RepID=UPI00048053F6|nr:DUF2799 domain-containing protein [Enterovibrio calviensis]
MFKKSLTALLAVVLVGCVHIEGSDSLIQKGDWQTVGVRDGERGVPSKSMASLKKLAVKAGVDNVDVGDYEAGYNEGVDRYCNVDNAYDIGLSGMQYLGVCSSKEDGVRFQLQWQRGFEDFQSADQTF